MINFQPAPRFLCRRRITAIAGLSLALCGCSTVGPTSIRQGRLPYNEVIQNTSEEQTLLNLVRVHNQETPFFMDVTEVDAAATFTGSINGGASGIGASGNAKSTSAGTIAGVVGAITGTAQYQEAPTIRYQPLLGSALVSQVSTPISADSIASLYNSGWSLGAILDLTAVRLTPGYDQYHAAVNALMELDRYGGLILASNPEKDTVRTDAGNKVSVSIGGSQGSKENDSLFIYYQKANLRSRFSTCDDQVRPHIDRNAKVTSTHQAEIDQIGENIWKRIQFILNQEGKNPIVLRAKPGSPPAEKSPERQTRNMTEAGDLRPQLRTRSALGVMQSAAEGNNFVYFADPSKIDDIIGRSYNKYGDDNGCNSYFWQASDSSDPRYSNSRFSTLDSDKIKVGVPDFEEERVFSQDRRLILVEVTSEKPQNAFISVFNDGKWYSIEKRDDISKRNMALITQINTIQAVASSSAPLTPTITVGAR